MILQELTLANNIGTDSDAPATVTKRERCADTVDTASAIASIAYVAAAPEPSFTFNPLIPSSADFFFDKFISIVLD